MRKPVDKATPLITKALATNQVIEASVRFYPDNEMLGAGTIGRMLEEFAFTFSTITWSSVFGSLVTFTDEIAPPA